MIIKDYDYEAFGHLPYKEKLDILEIVRLALIKQRKEYKIRKAHYLELKKYLKELK